MTNERKTFVLKKPIFPTASIVQEDGFVSLAKIGRNEFKKEQDPSLKEIRAKAKIKKSHFEIRHSLVVRSTKDNRRNEIIQLAVPLKYGIHILGACHERISSHLGDTKTTDKILCHFF